MEANCAREWCYDPPLICGPRDIKITHECHIIMIHRQSTWQYFTWTTYYYDPPPVHMTAKLHMSDIHIIIIHRRSTWQYYTWTTLLWSTAGPHDNITHERQIMIHHLPRPLADYRIVVVWWLHRHLVWNVTLILNLVLVSTSSLLWPVKSGIWATTKFCDYKTVLGYRDVTFWPLYPEWPVFRRSHVLG